MRFFNFLDVSHLINLIDCHKKPARDPIKRYFLFVLYRATSSICILDYFRSSCRSLSIILYLSLESSFFLMVRTNFQHLLLGFFRSSQGNFTFKYDVHFIALFTVKFDFLPSLNQSMSYDFA
jgi:hypothetical protein